MAEGCAVVARAPALLWDVQIPLAVEGDPVLRPRRLVAPLARHLIKGSRWYLLHCLATQDLTPEIYVRGRIHLKSSISHIYATSWWTASSILHMKAMHVPFHMGYVEMICSKRLQSDRPK